MRVASLNGMWVAWCDDARPLVALLVALLVASYLARCWFPRLRRREEKADPVQGSEARGGTPPDDWTGRVGAMAQDGRRRRPKGDGAGLPAEVRARRRALLENMRRNQGEGVEGPGDGRTPRTSSAVPDLRRPRNSGASAQTEVEYEPEWCPQGQDFHSGNASTNRVHAHVHHDVRDLDLVMHEVVAEDWNARPAMTFSASVPDLYASSHAEQADTSRLTPAQARRLRQLQAQAGAADISSAAEASRALPTMTSTVSCPEFGIFERGGRLPPIFE